MAKEHHAVIVPGLGDNVLAIELATLGWKYRGIHPIVYDAGWRSSETYDEKLERLVQHIHKLHESGLTISLVGISAGASHAINAFMQTKDQIHRLALVCGPLHTGLDLPRGLHRLFHMNPAFGHSVLQAQYNILNLSLEERQRVLVVRPLRDGLVPHHAMKIEGANQTTIPMLGHIPSIFFGLTVFGGRITNFMKQEPHLQS